MEILSLKPNVTIIIFKRLVSAPRDEGIYPSYGNSKTYKEQRGLLKMCCITIMSLSFTHFLQEDGGRPENKTNCLIDIDQLIVQFIYFLICLQLKYSLNKIYLTAIIVRLKYSLMHVLFNSIADHLVQLKYCYQNKYTFNQKLF